jgi:hypothetical protein
LTGVPGIPSNFNEAQSSTAQVATLTLTTVSGVVSAGGVTRLAQIATLTLNGVAGGSISGPRTTTAQVAALLLVGVPGSSGIGFRTDAQTATVTLTGLQGVSRGGATAMLAQIAQIILTGVRGISVRPFAVSAHSYSTPNRSQRVEIRVNDVDKQWAVFVRGPETVLIEQPGYYVTHTSGLVDWYRAGELVAQTAMTFPTTAGTVELECNTDLCILRVHGVEVARHDFSAAPLTGDDGHQGFAAYGGAALIITDAEGGALSDVPAVAPGQVRRPL